MKQWTVRMAAAMTLALTTAASASAQARGWAPPDCELSTGHYLVNSAVLYLKSFATTRYADQRTRDLRDARRVLLQALEQDRDDDPAVWYFLGRYYAEVNDLVGLDSAFDRAARLAPNCAADIRNHRRRLWVPILNQAVDRIRASDNAAAKEALYRANAVYESEPPGFYYLGQLYANERQTDSAVRYFAMALTLASDSANRGNEQYDELRRDATFNVASLFHMRQQYDSAVAWYARYRADQPGDAQAITRHAEALDAGGHNERALALYDTVLARADSIAPLDLFQAGVTMFRAKRFARAAEAFEKGLERNPHYRDAIFNLANTYLSMANEADSAAPAAEVAKRRKQFGEKMTPVARRLIDLDPHSTSARRLLAASYQLQNHSDSTLAVLETIEQMRFEVTVSQFRPVGAGHEVRGLVINLSDGELPVPDLTFEFLNAQGEIVQALKVPGKAVEAGGGIPFTLSPVGEGIAAWRYRTAS